MVGTREQGLNLLSIHGYVIVLQLAAALAILNFVFTLDRVRVVGSSQI